MARQHPPAQETDLPRWFSITHDLGTMYLPLGAVGFGLLLHALGWRTTVDTGYRLLPIGFAIAFSGLGALLTWLILGVVLFVRDTIAKIRADRKEEP